MRPKTANQIGIVERLRFDAIRCEAQFSKGVASNITDGADTIDRLQRELADARAEVARLTAYRDGQAVITAQLEAEIGRLRATLKEIAAMRREDLPLADGEPEDNLAARHARLRLEQGHP